MFLLQFSSFQVVPEACAVDRLEDPENIFICHVDEDNIIKIKVLRRGYLADGILFRGVVYLFAPDAAGDYSLVCLKYIAPGMVQEKYILKMPCNKVIAACDETDDVTWDVEVDGLVFLGSNKSGTIAPNSLETIKVNPIGFGPITIKITVGGDEKTYSAFLLGFITLNLEEIQQDY